MGQKRKADGARKPIEFRVVEGEKMSEADFDVITQLLFAWWREDFEKRIREGDASQVRPDPPAAS
jgi:hypothetical protein